MLNFFIYFLIGLCLGSFLNGLYWRTVHKIPLITVRSRCVGCKRQLGLIELIPIVGYIISLGKCRVCGAKIPWEFPLIELISAIMTAWIFSSGDILNHLPLLGFWFLLLLNCVTDLKTGFVYNRFLYPMVGLALILAWTQNHYSFGLFLVRGLIFGATIWLLTLVLSKLLRKQAMGSADYFLFYSAGFLLTVGRLIPFIWIAAGLGMIGMLIFRVGKLPFFPCLAVSLWIMQMVMK